MRASKAPRPQFLSYLLFYGDHNHRRESQLNQIAQVIDLIRSGLNPGQPHASHGANAAAALRRSAGKGISNAEEAFEAGGLTISELDGGIRRGREISRGK